MKTAMRIRDVSAKKNEPKRYGTMIRVSHEFAETLRDVTWLERISIAESANAYLLPVVRKRYRDGLPSKS